MQLYSKFENDLKQLRKKYEFVEIDIQTPVQRTKKSKITDELFKSYWEKGMKIKEIAELTGYNSAYLSKMKKRIITE